PHNGLAVDFSLHGYMLTDGKTQDIVRTGKFWTWDASPSFEKIPKRDEGRFASYRDLQTCHLGRD
ncbi:13973_t:CDS:2, partial [Acaulospora colombiana]